MTEPIHCTNRQPTILWEALVHLDNGKPELANYMQALGQSACMSWQEIGLSPSADGWIIHIRACNEDGIVDILIPKDRTRAVEVLKDTRSTASRYKD